MNVTVEVVGEGSHDLEVEDATYADLLAEVDLSPHEVSVMVEGRPVPEDQPVEADHVKVLRLIKGGAPRDVRVGGRRGRRITKSELSPRTDRGAASASTEAGPVALSERERRTLGVSELVFELPNAGAGPDPVSLSALADDPRNDAVVILFLRDYRARSDREYVQSVADRYGEFRDRDAAVVAVLPEPKATAQKLQRKLHLPFALAADGDKSVAARYGQPTRWGRLGELHDLLGRLPETALVDARHDPELYAVRRGDGGDDWPEVDNVLGMVDRMRADEP